MDVGLAAYNRASEFYGICSLINQGLIEICGLVRDGFMVSRVLTVAGTSEPSEPIWAPSGLSCELRMCVKYF